MKPESYKNVDCCNSCEHCEKERADYFIWYWCLKVSRDEMVGCDVDGICDDFKKDGE